MKIKNLKRLAALIFCVALCLTAVACGKQSGKKAEESSSSPESSAQGTVEAGNTAEAAQNETEEARTEEASEAKQTEVTAKATEKPAEKQTEKKTEKQTSVPKTETQTFAKKKLTQADLDELNRETKNRTRPNSYVGMEENWSRRGNSLVLSTTDASGLRSDKGIIDLCTDMESTLLSTIERLLATFDIDSVIFEGVNQAGKVVYSKEYK